MGFRIVWRRRLIHTDKSKIIFRDGQTTKILGRHFTILVSLESERKNSTAKLDGEIVKVKLSGKLSRRSFDKHISTLSRRCISNALLPILNERINEFNRQYFNSTLGKIRIKDNLSNWGSCSRANNINLDFRLLLGPIEVLDAVILHELAHTMHHNHSADFHAILHNAVPDYKNRMKWLRANGHRLMTDATNLTYQPANMTIVQEEAPKTAEVAPPNPI